MQGLQTGEGGGSIPGGEGYSIGSRGASLSLLNRSLCFYALCADRAVLRLKSCGPACSGSTGCEFMWVWGKTLRTLARLAATMQGRCRVPRRSESGLGRNKRLGRARADVATGTSLDARQGRLQACLGILSQMPRLAQLHPAPLQPIPGQRVSTRWRAGPRAPRRSLLPTCIRCPSVSPPRM